jgi:exonuclease III
MMTDVRLKDKGGEVQKLMGLTRNGSYKVYFNSSKESRGVGIAIKRNIKHEIVNRFVGNADENVLLLDIILKGVRLTLGVIYGPNNTDREFFHSIERQIVAWGNKCIIGGDFNTIICQDNGRGNLDREGDGRVPNIQNSKNINSWIRNEFVIDPFRALYPEAREVSYVSFRRDGVNNEVKWSKTRLDFFLISPELIDWISKIKYEDRLGSDFDHKEVTLWIGRQRGGGEMTIHDSTIEDLTVVDIGC